MGEAEPPAGTVPGQVKQNSAESRGAVAISDVLGGDLAGQQEAVRQRVARAAAQKPVPHPTVEERARKGRIARAETPRPAIRLDKAGKAGVKCV